MANQFLVEIHNYISGQIEQGRKACEQARSGKDHGGLSFCEGKLDELQKLREYLSDAFDLYTQRYY